MSSDFQLKCARCGRNRWSQDGVCPACGYEAVISPTVMSADGWENEGPEAQVPTRRPWLLLLLGGVVAIALAQLSFGLSASTTLPAAGVVSILLGVALIASYTLPSSIPVYLARRLQAVYPKRPPKTRPQNIGRRSPVHL